MTHIHCCLESTLNRQEIVFMNDLVVVLISELVSHVWNFLCMSIAETCLVNTRVDLNSYKYMGTEVLMHWSITSRAVVKILKVEGKFFLNFFINVVTTRRLDWKERKFCNLDVKDRQKWPSNSSKFTSNSSTFFRYKEEIFWRLELFW